MVPDPIGYGRPLTDERVIDELKDTSGHGCNKLGDLYMIVKIKKHKKGIIYLGAFLIPFTMVQVFWALFGIFPFGDNSILTGDMDLEFVNFYEYFINTFESKSDWSYMRAKTLGGDFSGLAAFQLHDPLLFILFLFPGEKIAAGVELLFTMQVSLAGLFMSVLLNNRFSTSWISLLFSTAYSFSGFFFGYLVLTIYFGCLALLPVLILCFLKYLDDDRYLIPYVLLTALFIFINFHMGFMLVIFLCILFVSRIIADGSYAKRISSFIISGVTILLMDGFFLIRTGLSLIGDKTTKGADYGLYRRFEMNQVFAGFFSGCTKNERNPLIYCSVIAVIFAIIYLISGRVSIREKLANLFVIVSVMVSMWINTLDAVWHGFNNPEGFYFRYAFFISFMVIAVGYKGAMLLLSDEETEKDGNRTARVLMAGGIVFLYMIWLKIRGNIYLDTLRLIINMTLVALITIFILFAVNSKKMRIFALLTLMLISFGDMLYNSVTAYHALNADDGQPPKMSEFKKDYTEIYDVISYIKNADSGFYRIEKDFDRAVNDPAMFDYMGMSHDSSCEKDKIIDWLNNFGFPRTVYYTYYNNGGTAFTDAFFGIRYFVSKFDIVEKPYSRMDYKGKYYPYLNEYALPIAYVAPEGLAEYDFADEDLFKKQNRLASFWGEGNEGYEIYREAAVNMSLEGAEETAPGHYRRNEGRGYVVYSIEITDEMPLYVYFTAPSRQRANLIIDGKDVGRYFSENHWNVVCAGKYKPGYRLEVRLEILDDEIEVTRPCFYYEDPTAIRKWAETAAGRNEPLGEINEIRSSHLVFDTDADETERIMMSIPYDTGWKITCDGKRIDTGEALGALMSFYVPEGHHTIEMKYVPHGTMLGIITSAMGLLLFAWLCFGKLKSQAAKI